MVQMTPYGIRTCTCMYMYYAQVASTNLNLVSLQSTTDTHTALMHIRVWLYYISIFTILYVVILYYQGYAETGEDPVTALLCIQRVVGEDLHPVQSLSTRRLGL